MSSFLRHGVIDLSNPSINIFLVTYNYPAELAEVVRRIYRHTKNPFALTIVDNNSDGKTQRLLKQLRQAHDNLTVIRNFRNRWCGGGSNQALRLAEESYAVYLCSRECFPMQDGWDVRCTDFMESHPKVALAGHLISSPRYADGRGYKQLERFPRFRRPDYVETRLNDRFYHVQGGFYVLRMEAARQVGFFNPEIPHDHMDVEYAYYLEAQGWQIADLPFVNIIHRTTRPKLEGYNPAQAVYHPLTLPELNKYEKKKRQYEQMTRQCNICGWKGPRFNDMVAPRYVRRDSTCPRCGSHERHRALVAYLLKNHNLKDKRLLDIAPVKGFEAFFKKQGSQYFSMNYGGGAQVRADLRHTPFADGSFEVIICYHVLEHIKEDGLAASEMSRMLGRGGQAFIQVPQDRFRWKTVEFDKPDEANHEHVRAPGLDYGLRLAAPGIKVEEKDLADDFSLDHRVRHGFYKDTGLTYCLTREQAGE